MHQKEFWRNSRSLPERFQISWLLTQNWSNWRSMHPDGRGGAWSIWDIKRLGLSLNTSGDEMHRWYSYQTLAIALTKLHRLHRESWEQRLAPIPFWQYQKWHPSSSSSSTTWWQWNDSLVELKKFIKVKHLWAREMSGIIERCDPLSGFFTQLLKSDTLQDPSSLPPSPNPLLSDRLQLTAICAVRISHHRMRHLHALMLCVWFSATLLSSSCCIFSPIVLVHSSWLSASSSTVWWTNPLCTSDNEDLGTLAEYDPLKERGEPTVVESDACLKRRVRYVLIPSTKFECCWVSVCWICLRSEKHDVQLMCSWVQTTTGSVTKQCGVGKVRQLLCVVLWSQERVSSDVIRSRTCRKAVNAVKATSTTETFSKRRRWNVAKDGFHWLCVQRFEL